MPINYCESLTSYKRRKAAVVNIGDVPLGGDYPIRLQSMTTTDTMDTIATVEQSIRMIEAGCEYVRITAPSIREAENLRNIKDELRKRGYKTPLIADIHFTPNAAELAAKIVEKVRVNPGNYADKKKFEHIEYTDKTYNDELERIRQRFTPLVKICKEYGTAMRIGANHGSLSDRILSRYGDTPLGMVESVMEFIRICEDNGFRQLVISMKASNPLIMVEAYRLLVFKMNEAGMDYPLHLGVTEAGEGEDGRIKSAAGIGTLLQDGLGDTIRVSLTEEPEYEIPVAKILATRNYADITSTQLPELTSPLPYSPYEYKKRATREILNIGGKQHPVVIVNSTSLNSIGYKYNENNSKWNKTDQGVDYIYTGDNTVTFELPEGLSAIYNSETWKQKKQDYTYPYFSSPDEFVKSKNKSSVLNFVLLKIEDSMGVGFIPEVEIINNDATAVFVVTAPPSISRRIFIEFLERGFHTPVIIGRNYESQQEEEFKLYSATDAGALLMDGMGEGLWLTGSLKPDFINRISFGILQATRTRISKTEYISCPSCGRTLFNLQEVTAGIHKRTAHLKGVKIGIMGCIVNGPGEMADADYGYVGTGAGKITLYKGKQVVLRNIPSGEAVEALVSLIKENGDWKEESDW